ncbi:MAG: sulfatase [Acidobacteriota bacterium]
MRNEFPTAGRTRQGERTGEHLRWIMLSLPAILLLGTLASCREKPQAESEQPNFIVIFADDLGYGDLGCFGHPTIRTPNLDRLAYEGQRWTNFYVAAPVCTPSRAALLTGRYPLRNGMCDDVRGVLFPDSAGGLPPEEITIAEILKQAGYATACIGKWHLGHLPEYLPTRQGFDYYFGIPYSNDMDRSPDSPPGRAAFDEPRIEYWNVPLMRNEEIIERPADQTTITRRYTEETIRLIRENRDRPFFIYLAHTMVHVPLFVSPEFRGRSLRGLYGDAVEEIDDGVGRILATLEELGLERRTLVVFTSDNGPWLTYDVQGGSAGPLRGGKGSTWEGGMRVPAIFWGPGLVRPGVVMDLGSTLDLLPTLARLAGVAPPGDRVLDGFDLSPVLAGTGSSPRQDMLFYRGTRLFAVRHGRFKLHYATQKGYNQPQPEYHEPPLLYDLGADPGEQYNIADRFPEAVAEIQRIAAEHRRGMVPGEPQLRKRIGE